MCPGSFRSTGLELSIFCPGNDSWKERVLTLGQAERLDVFEYLLEGHLLDSKETQLVGLFNSFTAGKPPRSRPERYILRLQDCKAKQATCEIYPLLNAEKAVVNLIHQSFRQSSIHETSSLQCPGKAGFLTRLSAATSS